MNFEKYKEEQEMEVTEQVINKIQKEGVRTTWISDVIIDYIALEFEKINSLDGIFEVTNYYDKASATKILADLVEYLI